MLDICLLGTGGMMPLPRRWLTSLMTRYNGSNLMIDCGEAVSYTHLDVYKRQPAWMPTLIPSPAAWYSLELWCL